MSLQPSSQSGNLLNKAASNASANGEVLAAKLPNSKNIPPRPAWLKSKSTSTDQRKPIDFQDIKNYINRPDHDSLRVIINMALNPLSYVPQLSGLGISFLLHGIFLLILCFLTFSSGAFQQGELTLLSGDGGDDLAMTRIDTSVAMDVSPSQLSQTTISMAAMESSQFPENHETIGQIEASIFEKQDSDSNPFKGAFAPPAGSNIVTKGSFAAYTVPNDPIPEQTYYIVILIKVPKGLDKYPVSDLSGNIIGTDGWEQPIVDKIFQQRNKYLEVKDHVAQLIVQVPGAYKLVRDKISIKSKMLKENQRLEIEF